MHSRKAREIKQHVRPVIHKIAHFAKIAVDSFRPKADVSVSLPTSFSFCYLPYECL